MPVKTVGALFATFALLTAQASTQPKPAPAEKTLAANQYERRTIYHSPQSPGYTCWVGAWQLADGSLMCSFTQATGPLASRPRASDDLIRERGWELLRQRPSYDFTGLDLANVYLRSKDEGKTWERVAEDSFKTPGGQMSQGGSQIQLKDGSILRAVFGYHLPLNPELPQTGFLQRSTDYGKTWGLPQVLLSPDRVTYRVTRIRRLRDGRLIATGGIVDAPPASVTENELTERWRPLLMVSADDGKSWKGPVEVLTPEQAKGWSGEEWDAAELPSGDLLAIFRRRDPVERAKQVRWQGLLRKRGDRWVTQELGPSVFPHSGHPDLLAVREGVILHVATTGLDWTDDAGKTWHPVRFPTLPEGYRSGYYPIALQLKDGRILVFSHVGTHNGYGDRDQSVLMDSFRLSTS